MKKAVITGISGQDGAYLALNLLEKGYKVIGAERRNASGSRTRLEALGIDQEVEFEEFELLEFSNMCRLLEKSQADEIYNLAAQSFVGASFDIPITTCDATGLGAARLLEAIRTVSPEAKFYQASSSEMFGQVLEIPQSESTPFYPRSPYAAAKAFAHYSTVNYRESFDLFACSGILFNHESPLRGFEFVTRKITSSLAKIKNEKLQCLELGNLEAQRDWGFAGDYVEAMTLMLAADEPDDFVVSTGETHSVFEFIELALEFMDFRVVWEGEGEDIRAIEKHSGKTIIKVNPKFYRPAEVELLIGDPSKARKQLNWRPKTNFNSLVEMMAEHDMRLYSD